MARARAQRPTGGLFRERALPLLSGGGRGLEGGRARSGNRARHNNGATAAFCDRIVSTAP